MLQITPKALKSLRIVKAWDAYRDRQRKTDKAKKKAKFRALDRNRFDELVGDITRIMKQGQPTPFAFEGSCRHGVRSSLCLDGWSWPDADNTAAEVIAAALGRIGATRPTWFQGQPEYADTDTSRGFCAHRRCGRPIPIERGLRNGKPVKYCCDECGHMATAEIRRREGRQVSMAEWLALCAARSSEKERQRSRNCDQCGTFFVTRDAKRKFCSRTCFFEAEKKWQDRECLNCGKTFSPKNSGPKAGVSRYCSRLCGTEGRKKSNPRPALSCVTCATIFYPIFPSDKRRYCSPTCNPFASKAAKSAFRCDETG